MALPASGGTYSELLQPGINPLKIRKWIVTDLLLRDYRAADGTIRNLADPSVGLNADGDFSPFAEDGTLRNDLIGPDGLGFYHLGALHEDGTEIKSDTSSDETMIAQSVRAVRYDLKSDTDTVQIRASESTPLTDALRFDKPLDNLEDYGKAGYVIKKDADTKLIERQVIALGFDGENFVGQVFPRMQVKDKAGSNMNKKDVDDVDITLGALLCPFVMSPVLLAREGAAWRGLQGAPVFAAAPVATAISGQQATVAFAMPTSGSSTYTYMVEKSSDSGTTWTTATPVSTTGTTSVVITVSGVTSSLSWQFRVKATGSNAMTTTSSVSNTVIGLT